MSGSPSRPPLLVLATVAVGWLAGLIVALLLARPLGSGDTVALPVSVALFLVPPLVSAGAFFVVASGAAGRPRATVAVFLGAVATTFLGPLLGGFALLAVPLATGAVAVLVARLLLVD